MARVFFCTFFMLGLMVFNAQQTFGKNVLLEVGETYQEENITVMCVESKGFEPVIMKDCQYWDDFNKKCLYEKKTHIAHALECIEDCQHWDRFSNKCFYETKCIFYPSQKLFIKKTCEKFDSFTNSCVKSKESKIYEK